MAQTSIPSDPEETPLLYLRAIRDILNTHTDKLDDIIARLERLEREAAAARRLVDDLLK